MCRMCETAPVCSCVLHRWTIMVFNMYDSSNLFLPANRTRQLFMLYAQVDDHGVQFV